jgi:hypothetical protein
MGWSGVSLRLKYTLKSRFLWLQKTIWRFWFVLASVVERAVAQINKGRKTLRALQPKPKKSTILSRAFQLVFHTFRGRWYAAAREGFDKRICHSQRS